MGGGIVVVCAFSHRAIVNTKGAGSRRVGSGFCQLRSIRLGMRLFAINVKQVCSIVALHCSDDWILHSALVGLLCYNHHVVW